jgi:hypothetical protein
MIPRTKIKAGEFVAIELGDYSDRQIRSVYRFTRDVDLEPIAKEVGVWSPDADDRALAAFDAAIQEAGAEEIDLHVLNAEHGIAGYEAARLSSCSQDITARIARQSFISLEREGRLNEDNLRSVERLVLSALSTVLPRLPKYEPEDGPSIRYQAAQLLAPALKELRAAQVELGISPNPEVAKLMHLAEVL